MSFNIIWVVFMISFFADVGLKMGFIVAKDTNDWLDSLFTKKDKK